MEKLVLHVVAGFRLPLAQASHYYHDNLSGRRHEMTRLGLHPGVTGLDISRDMTPSAREPDASGGS